MQSVVKVVLNSSKLDSAFIFSVQQRVSAGPCLPHFRPVCYVHRLDNLDWHKYLILCYRHITKQSGEQLLNSDDVITAVEVEMYSRIEVYIYSYNK